MPDPAEQRYLTTPCAQAPDPASNDAPQNCALPSLSECCQPMSKKYCLCERRPRPRVRIYYEDEDMRARYNANATRVLALVQQDPTATTSHAQMALKVLKYRKMAERAAGIDLQDPTFDVAQFFGIEWCKSTPVREGNIP